MSSRLSLRWLDDPVSGSGLRCFQPDGSWAFYSYPLLARRCHLIAGGLVRAGVRRNDRVVVISGSGPDFVAAFFGVLSAGATVSVVAPPLPLQSAGYAEHVMTTLSAVTPSAVVADPSVREHLTQVLGRRVPVPVHSPDELAEDGDRLAGRAPADIALIQFTSGTGGRPRGVRIPFDALEANTAAIRGWLRAGPADEWASWLPMHHDMGLIGCLVTPVTGGNGLWLTRPEDFVRDPMHYLRCFGAGTATITATPGFGLERIVRKVSPRDLDGLDFSSWRAIVVGAERVDPEVLGRFDRLLAPHGLAGTALVPAYGLAEATLAVTGVPVGRGWVDTEVRADSLAIGRSTVPAQGPSQRVLGCGLPIGDMSVRVVDEAGAPLPDGFLGEIEVRGGSVGAGYLDDSDGAATNLTDGVLSTGDAGFLLHGELYVLGRVGDSVKVRGRSIFAEDVEQQLRKTGAPPHRLAVVLGERRGVPVAIVVLEDPEKKWIEHAAQLMRSCCAGARVSVVAAPAGTIPRTPSGKGRRRELWCAFVAGDLDGIRMTTGSRNLRPGGGEQEGHSGNGAE